LRIHRNPCEDCEAELVYLRERSAVFEGGTAVLSFAARNRLRIGPKTQEQQACGCLPQPACHGDRIYMNTSLALPRVRRSVLAILGWRWPAQYLGPYSLVARFIVFSLLLLGVSRAGLMWWQWPRVVVTDSWVNMLLQGARSDLMTAGLFAAPIVLLLPIFGIADRVPLWVRWCTWWLAFSLIAMLFLELATPQFLIEFDGRPNRLFIEYMQYPREVLAMLWGGYRMLLIVALAAVAAMAIWTLRHFDCHRCATRNWTRRTVLLVWPLVVVLLFVMIRSSFQHRPANLSTFAFCDDAMVNSLVANSTYSVLTAVFGMKNESHSSDMYGKMPVAEMIDRVRKGMGVAESDFISEELPTLHRQSATIRRHKPRNLVIILEESLGAGFVERLGGKPIAPYFNKLGDEGIWFQRLYATGTRSVRGIEAVIAGFPPTPAQSTVKLSKSQRDFATLASVLRKSGYRSEFVYGGESHFDNMRGFFLGNGFSTIVDRSQFKQPKFVGSWGVSDEDLFDMAHQRIAALDAADEPFFLLVFSSTNHTPFEFPDGRIALADVEKQTVNNAVKYADFAMGGFIERARRSDYWDETVMMVVADHDTRVFGNDLVPIDKFHIPGVILGEGIQPLQVASVASQIDLAPTLLSLLGVDSEHPFVGRDLTRTLPEFGNAAATLKPRAMMQFDRNYAWLEEGRATILLPDGSAKHFAYDDGTREFRPEAFANTDVARDALANVLMASWLYREQRYRDTPGRQRR
jgi:phosphoglycerol transferase MdoB-like AlkP superfamily enzyme